MRAKLPFVTRISGKSLENGHYRAVGAKLAAFISLGAEPAGRERLLPRHHVSLLASVLLAAPPLVLSAPAGAAVPVRAAGVPVVAKGEFCRITGSSATVRARPRAGATALGTTYKGDTCIAHGWAEGDGAWVKVTIKRTGVTGYVQSSRVAWGQESLVRTSM
ncbi:SH3 domain-containing protein [Streptomyces sp. NPDC001848]|uniref:SH3 domain-containing protein n=1 Tax=Streptomyces sp. NPDC001848 TaxID=3364618 RepID=UPI0036CCBB77